MKKIIFTVFMSVLSALGYGQLSEEGFENGWTLAATGDGNAGWFTFQNGVGTNVKWTQGPVGNPSLPPRTGDRAAYLQRENVSSGLFAEDYLVTPQFNVPEEPELRFFSRLTVAEDQGSIYKVFILDLTANPTADLNAPASYVELQSWTEFQINPAQLTYNEIVVPLPDAYVGKQVRIALMMRGDDMDRWLVDDLKVVKKCLAPLTLASANETLTGADLSWANPSGSTTWEIEVIGEDDQPTGVATATHTGALPYHVDGLAEDTCYKFYVRSICEGGGESLWVGAFYFCTKKVGANCNFPIIVSTLPFSDEDTTASFADEYNGLPGTGCGNNSLEDYLSGNDVVYKYTATFTGAVNIDFTDNGPNSGIFVYNECENIGVSCLAGGKGGPDGDPVFLEDFPVVNGEDYYIVISSYNELTIPYQLIIQAVACDEPTNLSVGTTTLTSAELSWDDNADATSWQVALQTAGSDIPSGAGTVVNDNSDYLWTGLTASTAYQYWVRADCGNGSFSAWAGPFQFNTQICDTTFQCELTFTMWDQLDTWNGHTMSVKQNGITVATLTGPGNDGAPVEVTVPLCNSMPVQLFWNTGGTSSAAADVGVSIKNSFNQTMYSKPPGTGIPGIQLYEVVVNCGQLYCLPPEGLTATNATQTTIDLGWAGDPTGEWDYYIVPQGDPAPDAATLGTVTTTNPVTAAGLTSATNYDYYVKTHCENTGTSTSNWAGPFTFSTSVCDPVDKCMYQFILIASWGGWNNGATITVRQNGITVAVLGADFTSGTSMYVDVALCNNMPFDVFVSEDGGLPEQIGFKIINNFDQTIFELVSSYNGLPSGTLFEGNVDCLLPLCQAPTGLKAYNATMTSIDLGWDGPATGNWEYVVLPAGSPAPDAATSGVATITNPTLGVPLEASATNYEYYVRALCTDATTLKSEWAGPFAMHSEVCAPEDKCIFHFELLSQNGWSFQNNTMTVYQSGVPVAVLGPQFDWSAPDLSAKTIDVPLCPGEEIEIVWDTVGPNDYDKGIHMYSPYWEEVFVKDFGEGAQGTTIFTGLVSCDPPACSKPIELALTNAQLTSVDLSWNTQGSTATSWEVWVLPYGSPVPDPATTPGTIVTTNPYTVNGLTSGTAYVYYIRANCGATDGYSSISSLKAFFYGIANDECDAAIDLSVNSGVECITSVAGTVTGATSSGTFPSCYWMSPDYDVWYKFIATDTQLGVSINDVTGAELGFAVYEGDCDGLTAVGCATPTYPQAGALGLVSGLTVGTTYYVQVYATYMPNPQNPSSFNVCISTPASIIVDNTMVVEDIVNTALVVETCANIQNITYSTGTTYGYDVSGIGYFEKALSNFGIEKGVVLMSGDASKAAGPNIGAKLSGGSWQGDQDLFNYITDLGVDPELYTYSDATVLEFDFTPLANRFRFPFIFASEEYGTFQCSYSDAFAFFLTELNADGTPAGPVTNLAVVPVTNDPVSVVTIRDNDFNPIFFDCPALNPEYFGQYYGLDSVQNPDAAMNPMTAPINFQGDTVKMYAQADVIPNHTYHIKLVIADRNEGSMDSAVFVGAFEIGKPDLGEDLTVAAGNGLCTDASYTILSNLPAGDYTFQWYRKLATDAAPVLIPGATGADYVVTPDAGNWGGNAEYSVIASFGGLCTSTDVVKIEFYAPVLEPTNLVVCDADGFGTFNLSDNNAVLLANVSNPSAYTISYHLTQADADNNVNELPLTGYNNVSQGLQEIYVRIVNEAGCVAIKSFSLVVRALTPLFTVNADFSICENTNGTIAVTPTLPANYDPALVTYSWTLDGVAIAQTTASITVNAAGVYEVTVNNQGCSATDSVTMSVIPTPIADELDDVSECGAYELPVLSANNTYYSGTGSTGTQYIAGDTITTSGTIYIVARDAASGACYAESSFVVEIVPAPVVAIFEECQGNNYVLEANFDNDEIYNADNVTLVWTNAAGAELGNTSSITITDSGSYYLTITPTGTGVNKLCPVVVEAQIDNTTCLIPRGISPNGDGKNDEFDLTGLNVKKLEIFNRYGQQVYTKNDYRKEWTGQNDNGELLPTGTYFYLIEGSNGEPKTGWVYINRQEK